MLFRHHAASPTNLFLGGGDGVIGPTLQVLPVRHHLEQLVGSVHDSFGEIDSVRHVHDGSVSDSSYSPELTGIVTSPEGIEQGPVRAGDPTISVVVDWRTV